MSKWDFSILVMGTAIILCGIYGYAKLGRSKGGLGCLFMAAAWTFAVIATVAHPHDKAPFCE